MKETPYELLKDTEKKQLGKNEEAKMTIYNALPRKEDKCVFMCKTAKEVWHTLIITHQGNSQVKNCKIDLFTQEYEKFSISNEETIDSGFTRFNDIVTSLKSLDPDYSSKNHVRKFLHALPLKWRAKVMAIEEAKDLATLPLDELIRNLKVYEMILDNDGVDSKTTKEKVKSLALKAKVTRKQTSDDINSQVESDEEVDEQEAKAFNLLARNFQKFFRKGNRFGQGNRFSNGGNWFGKGRSSNFRNKGGESSKPMGACYNCGIEGHFSSERRKPKENKAFVGGSWSDSEDGDEQPNDATCLMDIDSQEVVSKPSSFDYNLNYIDLQKVNEELLKFKQEFTRTFEKLLKEKRSLENENSKF
ncbi:UBN2 domain-containing protein [Tanacetum coccineum]